MLAHDFTGGIYVLDIENCQVTQITEGESGTLFSGSLQGAFAWSPTGERLTFVRLESEAFDANAHLFVANADGSHQRQLTNLERKRLFNLAWSPDGSKIAFATLSIEQIESLVSDVYWTYDLQVLEADNPANVKTLITDLTRFYYEFSPDGTRIALVYGGFEMGGLFVLDVSTGELLQIADDAPVLPKPHWSPDGTQIAYTCRLEGAFATRAGCVISADGSRRVVLGEGWGPVWTVDGKHVVFPALEPGQVAYSGEYIQLHFVDPEDGRHLKVINNWPGQGLTAWLSNVLASGRHCKLVVPPNCDIFVTDLNSSQLWVILKEGCYASSTWSPDGRGLAFDVPNSPCLI